jgi:hypothetical protein
MRERGGFEHVVKRAGAIPSTNMVRSEGSSTIAYWFGK